MKKTENSINRRATMIQIKHVTKVYKLSKKQMKKMKTKEKIKYAADDISLEVNVGKIYGLLGPNGAGKTTVLRCVATLLKPTAGNILVNGYDVIQDSKKVRENIAFLTNEIKLDPNFSVDYLFSFFGHLHQMKDEEIEIRKKELFEYFGITNFANKKIEELSTGMKQKAAIAVSLAHDPQVIIFDEPTNGLDVITAKSVMNYMLKMRDEGKTVVISTHILTDAEKYCDQIGIIVEGKKVVEGTLEGILKETESKDLEDAFFKLYKEYSKEEI
jgi:sodium transport system ATP-binding protein